MAELDIESAIETELGELEQGRDTGAPANPTASVEEAFPTPAPQPQKYVVANVKEVSL
jgi:hypothetical protein